jgi:hypothetical protein
MINCNDNGGRYHDTVRSVSEEIRRPCSVLSHKMVGGEGPGLIRGKVELVLQLMHLGFVSLTFHKLTFHVLPHTSTHLASAKLPAMLPRYGSSSSALPRVPSRYSLTPSL